MAETAVVTEDDIAALLELDDEELAEVIGGTLGASRHHEDWQCLTHPDVLSRTIDVLGDMIQVAQNEANRINSALNAHKDGTVRLSSIEFGRHQRTRAELSSRKFMLDARLSQALNRRRALHKAELAAAEPLPDKQRAHLEREVVHSGKHRVAASRLALAIQRHRLDAVAAGMAPEPHDKALWRVLDEVTVPFDGGDATVTELLGKGMWKEQHDA